LDKRVGTFGSTCGVTTNHWSDHVYLVLKVVNSDEWCRLSPRISDTPVDLAGKVDQAFSASSKRRLRCEVIEPVKRLMVMVGAVEATFHVTINAGYA
jgi:hypothetical protein